MIAKQRFAVFALSFVLSLASAGFPRSAHSSIGETAMALAAPLAQQFGVPVSAVTGLLESGVSLDSVTQLLLIDKSSTSSLDDVTSLYRDSDKDIAKTAEKLDVDAEDYSQERVTAAIDEAKRTAQADATEEATGAASDALDSALGGLKR